MSNFEPDDDQLTKPEFQRRDDPKLWRAHVLKNPTASRQYGVKPYFGWDNAPDVKAAIRYCRDMHGYCTTSAKDLPKIRKLAAHVRNLGISETKALDLIVDYNKPPLRQDAVAYEVWHAYEFAVEPPGSMSLAQALHEDEPEEDTSWLEGAGAADVDAEAIEFDMNKLPAMLDHMEACLIKKNAPLYKIGGRVVHPIRLDKSTRDEGDEDAIRRDAGALIIRDVSPLRLREYAIEHVRFFKRGKSGRVEVPASIGLANHYLAREDKWRIPTLRGVIEAPTLRRDGSLIDAEGYDEASGLLLDFKGTKFPAIKEQPSDKEIADALALVKIPFKSFPFVDGPSRAVMLSAVLTALVRRTLFSAPMHGFSAPLMGTGKTLACNCVSLISVGRLATAMSQGASEEEDEKRFFSVLLQNDLITLIDNVKRPIHGDALCTILTEPTWQSRILGENRKVIVPTNSLWLASGNNLTFKGDMTTRALLCRMDAKIEKPETRRFDVDLKTWIPQHRPQLVAAGLTILRGYVAAGRPGQKTLVPFGRFEEWSDLIRGALVWIGEDDPCRTRAYITVDDPERATLVELLQALHAADNGSHRIAGDWIKAAESDWESPLRQAIEEVAPGLDKVRLGYFLKTNQGRIVGGLRLWERYDKHKKAWSYRVVEV